ncbi:MAG: 3-phosphoshikimate 1-carboxyvinyltransferase [Anaerolineae bacterium]|nr:3-phosphoshikimate 1-carboxyvinyltransferase [Anaerolineae bacterium]
MSESPPTADADLAIQPLDGPVDATIRVPGSKSITNRALALAALAEGTSTLDNALFSEDSTICAACLRQLGIPVALDAESARMVVQGQGGRIPAREASCFVGNSGTTARFLVALAALGRGAYYFDGVPRMRQRPVGPLLRALRALGAEIEAPNEVFPLAVYGRGLRGGAATIDSSASSQYLTALLQVAPYAEKDVQLLVGGALVSEPYIAMTMRLMAAFGVDVRQESGNQPDGAATVHDKLYYRNYSVRAGQRYRGQRYQIEPDASNASYFFAAAALTGGRVRVPDLTPDSLQGDVRFLDVLREMGCVVSAFASPDGGGIEVRGPAQLRGVDVDMNAISDTAQTLAAIAPFAAEPVTMRNIGHIRHKETDRIAAMVTELRRLGANVDDGPDWITIHPSALRPAAVETYDDHRMAMAFAVAGLRTPGLRIRNPGCTAKTFPDYFERFAALYTR